MGFGGIWGRGQVCVGEAHCFCGATRGEERGLSSFVDVGGDTFRCCVRDLIFFRAEVGNCGVVSNPALIKADGYLIQTVGLMSPDLEQT